MKKNDEINIEEEPFFYCKRCLSLDIREDDDICFCNNCGSLSIEEEIDMDKWVDMYNEAYIDDDNHKKFLYSNKKTFKKRKRDGK